MNRTRIKIMFALAAIIVVAVGGIAFASGGGNKFRTSLSGFNEDPLTISTPGHGTFEGRLNKNASELSYTVSFADIPTAVQQAHIHFGGRHQSGGIVLFLCTNLGNSPTPSPACPPTGGTVTGTLHASDVVPQSSQAIGANELAEVIDAMRAGIAYVNVHSAQFPGGEIRGQLRDHDHGHDNDNDN